MIGWLCDPFGFEVKLKAEGDNARIEQRELAHGAKIVDAPTQMSSIACASDHATLAVTIAVDPA